MDDIIEALGISSCPWGYELNDDVYRINHVKHDGWVGTIGEFYGEKNARLASLAPKLLGAIIQDAYGFDVYNTEEEKIKTGAAYDVWKERVTLIEDATDRKWHEIKKIIRKVIK